MPKKKQKTAFEKVCAKLGVELYRIPLNLAGYYVPDSLTPSKRPAVFINTQLSDEQASRVRELLALDQGLSDTDRMRVFYIPKGTETVVEAGTTGRSNHA